MAIQGIFIRNRGELVEKAYYKLQDTEIVDEIEQIYCVYKFNVYWDHSTRRRNIGDFYKGEEIQVSENIPKEEFVTLSNDQLLTRGYELFKPTLVDNLTNGRSPRDLFNLEITNKLIPGILEYIGV